MRGKRPRVLVLRLAFCILVFEVVLAVGSLSLSSTKDASFAVFSRGHSCHPLSLWVRPDAVLLVHRGAKSLALRAAWDGFRES